MSPAGTRSRAEEWQATALNLIDQGYDHRSWHGPNLTSAIRSLRPEEAAWRPDPGRRSVVEQVLHTAYWKYVVRRRLRGDKRGSFPLKGSNWFPVRAPLSSARLAEFVELLASQHRLLREVVGEIGGGELLQPVGGDPKLTRWALISGVAFHDVYHAGQIRGLRALWKHHQERGEA